MSRRARCKRCDRAVTAEMRMQRGFCKPCRGEMRAEWQAAGWRSMAVDSRAERAVPQPNRPTKQGLRAIGIPYKPHPAAMRNGVNNVLVPHAVAQLFVNPPPAIAELSIAEQLRLAGECCATRGEASHGAR